MVGTGCGGMIFKSQNQRCVQQYWNSQITKGTDHKSADIFHPSPSCLFDSSSSAWWMKGGLVRYINTVEMEDVVDGRPGTKYEFKLYYCEDRRSKASYSSSEDQEGATVVRFV
jgi:hypothetical protein